MKIVIVNGSARKGNTLTAIQAFAEGVAEKNEIEIIAPEKLNVAPCKGCGVCQCSKGCVDQDDTNPTIDKIVVADVIVFATPVYWWGMSAQLKLIIDKCYCKGLHLKNKQFQCMADYLSWNMLFMKSYSASDRADLSNNTDAIAELKELGSNLC